MTVACYDCTHNLGAHCAVHRHILRALVRGATLRALVRGVTV